MIANKPPANPEYEELSVNIINQKLNTYVYSNLTSLEKLMTTFRPWSTKCSVTLTPCLDFRLRMLVSSQQHTASESWSTTFHTTYQSMRSERPTYSKKLKNTYEHYDFLPNFIVNFHIFQVAACFTA